MSDPLYPPKRNIVSAARGERGGEQTLEAMVFAAGRGRPPKATKESGAVSFDADAGCFVGANGMYWHGTANGGWSRQPPSGDKETGEKSSAKWANVDEPEAAAKKKPRGRPPACGHVEHRWPLSAPGRAPGCPELRPASAKAEAARTALASHTGLVSPTGVPSAAGHTVLRR